jgi:hypothetical protein
LAVLAHPRQLGILGDDLEDEIVHLKDLGLDGIEIIHPTHTHVLTCAYFKRFIGFPCVPASFLERLEDRLVG